MPYIFLFFFSFLGWRSGWGWNNIIWLSSLWRKQIMHLCPIFSFSQETMSCNLSHDGGVSHSLIELLMAKASYAPMPYIFWAGLGEDRENRPLLLLLSLLLSFFSSLPSLKNISSFFSFFSLFPKKHPSLPSSLSSPSSPIWWSYSLMSFSSYHYLLSSIH